MQAVANSKTACVRERKLDAHSSYGFTSHGYQPHSFFDHSESKVFVGIKLCLEMFLNCMEVLSIIVLLLRWRKSVGVQLRTWNRLQC